MLNCRYEKALVQQLLAPVIFLPFLFHKSHHDFSLGKNDFLLDGKPFQIISGEMHPARIPREYWRHRIQMAKAMGCNTIAAYIFWNYHETKPGVFDFKTENRDIAEFVRICQQEGMWVIVSPGPLCMCRMGFWRAANLPAENTGYQDPLHGYEIYGCSDRIYQSSFNRNKIIAMQ